MFNKIGDNPNQPNSVGDITKEGRKSPSPRQAEVRTIQNPLFNLNKSPNMTEQRKIKLSPPLKEKEATISVTNPLFNINNGKRISPNMGDKVPSTPRFSKMKIVSKLKSDEIKLIRSLGSNDLKSLNLSHPFPKHKSVIPLFEGLEPSFTHSNEPHSDKSEEYVVKLIPDFNEKTWVKSPFVLLHLAQFMNQTCPDEQDDKKIVEQFISKKILKIMRLHDLIKPLVKFEPFLSQLLKIEDAREFCDKIKSLKKEEKRYLGDLVGKSRIACLKLSAKQETQKVWEEVIGFEKKLSGVNKKICELPSNFDEKYPIASINCDTIVSSFRSLYGVEFKEKKECPVFTINEKEVSCPNWIENGMYMTKLSERQTYFLEWLIMHFNETMGEKSITEGQAHKIMHALSNEASPEECTTGILCFRILQAISFSAYSHADTFLRTELCPLLMNIEATPCMKYFPTDDTQWKIRIDPEKQTFEVIHIKTYRIVKDRFEDSETALSLGSVNVHWRLQGLLKNSSFKASIWLEDFKLSEKLSLETRCDIIDKLNFN